MCAGTVYLTACTVLSTEHGASVTAVGVSEDGMKILAATASVSYPALQLRRIHLKCIYSYNFLHVH